MQFKQLRHVITDKNEAAYLFEAAIHDLYLFLGESGGLDKLFDWPRFVADHMGALLQIGVFLF